MRTLLVLSATMGEAATEPAIYRARPQNTSCQSAFAEATRGTACAVEEEAMGGDDLANSGIVKHAVVYPGVVSACGENSPRPLLADQYGHRLELQVAYQKMPVCALEVAGSLRAACRRIGVRLGKRRHGLPEVLIAVLEPMELLVYECSQQAVLISKMASVHG